MVPPLAPSEALIHSTTIIVFCFSQTQRPFFTMVPSAHHPGNSVVHSSASLFLVNLHFSLNNNLWVVKWCSASFADLTLTLQLSPIYWASPKAWKMVYVIWISGFQFICPKKREEAESEARSPCLSLWENCGFVLIDSLDSFASVDPAGTTTWAVKPLFTGALSDITPWSHP